MMLHFVATDLKWICLKHLAAKKGYKSTAGCTVCKLTNGSLPGFAINSCGAIFSKFLLFTDLSRLDGAEISVYIKGLGIGESSGRASFRAKQFDRQAIKVHKEYCKAANDLNSKYHHNPSGKNALLSFGPVAGKFEGAAIWLGIGCFGELKRIQ